MESGIIAVHTASAIGNDTHSVYDLWCEWFVLWQVYVFEGISKNVTSVGFYQNGQFMYSGGEDHTARLWDLRMG